MYRVSLGFGVVGFLGFQALRADGVHVGGEGFARSIGFIAFRASEVWVEKGLRV